MAPIPERLSLVEHKGIYNIVYHSGGRRHWKSTGAKTKPDALKKLTEFSDLLSKRVQQVSLDEFTRHLLTFAEASYRPGTVELYRHTLRRFQQVTGDLALSEMTA
jgi:hypothetical protein